jgi:tRNA threonylcarbamoyladenosine biosynthesis protein TsaB
LPDADAILALECSTDYGSVGLALGDGRRFISRFEVARAHGKTLMPLVDELFKRAGVERERLALIAVSLGPGSYTGLRVAIAAAQGLALALSIPCAGFETTEVVAGNIEPGPRPLAVLIDIRGEEVFCRPFKADGGRWRACAEGAVAKPASLSAGLDRQSLLAGSGAIAYRNIFEKAGFEIAPEKTATPEANVLLNLAMEARERGALVDPARLTPVYARPSYAEILRPADK